MLLRQRGWLKFQQEEFEHCKTLLEDSLRINPLDWHAWHELAACRRRLGDLAGSTDASQIALDGKELRKKLLQMSDAAAIQPDTLAEIAKYAKACGDQQTANAIFRRVRLLQQVRV